MAGARTEPGRADDGGGPPRAPRTLADLAPGETLAPAELHAVARALVDDARAHVARGDRPGTLGPRDVRLDGARSALVVRADDGKDAGAAGPWAGLDGLVEGPRAARLAYVVGLALYRAAAGREAFDLAALRQRARDADEGAPPFPTATSEATPPGLESLALGLLAPRGRRLDLAAAATWLETFAATPHARPGGPARGRPLDVPAPSYAHARARGRVAGAAVALALGVACAAGALARGAPASRDPAPGAAARAVRPRAPVALSGADECGGCHAREAAEWKASGMARSATSPLVVALEALVEEEVGRDAACPGGAGILRPRGAGACVDGASGRPVTGAGGEGWCVRCHAPTQHLDGPLAAWSRGDPTTRRPLPDVLGPRGREGVSCVACHAFVGPAGGARAEALGNPTWRSAETGATFSARPEDRRGLFGIGNSGYDLDPGALRVARVDPRSGRPHGAPTDEARRYLASPESCGACHDVRLFGTDVVGVAERGEHFKRLRNAYSEWRAYVDASRVRGLEPATCQGCHMSLYPGVCEPRAGAEGDGVCPAGTRFAPRDPGTFGRAGAGGARHAHHFTGVEAPVADDLGPEARRGRTLDADGAPTALDPRRLALLRSAVRLAVEPPRAERGLLRVPVTVENVGAGHRVPAGFSQERELWIELVVKDAAGKEVYVVGRLERPDEDLADKRFVRVTTEDRAFDREGRPLGMFGADVVDGPDAPAWEPSPRRGGPRFEGRGLALFQNGFLRCVRCVGVIDAAGRCQPGAGQTSFRAARYEDGDYDLDTGACRSNLDGDEALFETYFPVGALDASRGVLKAPDAILDGRSLAPFEPVTYTWAVPVAAGRGPFRAEARLLFRAFPPYLVRAFEARERARARDGARPSGALVGPAALRSLDVLELARAAAVSSSGAP